MLAADRSGRGPAYLDWNAGAPVRAEVIAAMSLAMAEPGNASSIHGAGRKARGLLETARRQVAALVGAEAANVIFTSGGTEANVLILRGSGRKRVLVSAVEHASVREARADVAILPVDAQGRVTPEILAEALAADPTPALVSVMLANNETGVLQPIRALAEVAKAGGALFHCDAAQGPGRCAVSLADLGVDFLTLSAHKLQGPPGVGALIRADSNPVLEPLLCGGGQEFRKRAGTENLPGIVGFGCAAALVSLEDMPKMQALRDYLEKSALQRVPGALVIAPLAERLCNTSCLALPEVASHIQVMALDLAGVAISAGAACSSGKVTESPVLRAMGWGPEVAGCAVRVSLGPCSTPEDIEAFLTAWETLVRRKIQGKDGKSRLQDVF